MGKINPSLRIGSGLLLFQNARNRCLLAAATLLFRSTSALHNPENPQNHAEVSVRTVRFSKTTKMIVYSMRVIHSKAIIIISISSPSPIPYPPTPLSPTTSSCRIPYT